MNAPADSSKIPYACSLCAFAVKQRLDATQIQPVLLCKFFPPVSTPQMSAKGMQLVTTFPVVEPGTWCFQFRPSQAAVDAAKSASDSAPARSVDAGPIPE